MEGRQRRSFTDDYKRQAVDLVASSGRSIGSVAKELGLRDSVLRRWVERGETFNYELEFLSRYPGLCIACGGRVCICPTVPPATVGRMAKEMPISVSRISDVDK